MAEINNTSKKSENYLKPYSDEEMLLEALIMYASQRQHYFIQIAEPNARNAENQKFSKKEIMYAKNCVEQSQRLVERAREKVESPIVLI